MHVARSRASTHEAAPRYDLLGEAFHADPAPVLHRMRREHPVWWDDRLSAWVLTRYDDVAFALGNGSFSVMRGGAISRSDDPAVQDKLRWCSEFVYRWMVFSDPPAHTQLRSTAHPAFIRRRIDRLRPEVERLTAEAIGKVSRAGRMELMADVAVPVPALVTATLMGLPAGDVEQLKGWTADMFALFGAGVASAEVVDSSHASMRSLETYFQDVVEDRRRRTRDDAVSDLVGHCSLSGLGDDALVGLMVTLLAGTFETTASLIGNGILALLRHPRERERVERDPGLLPHAVEEIFRYDGPATSVVRTALTDTELPSGTTMPEGDNVYCMLYAANRDPARFPGPDTFDVGRDDVAHTGLGKGIHFCLGAPLVRLEAPIILRRLLELDDLRIDEGALPGGPTFEPNLAIRGPRSLPLMFVRTS